MTETAAPVAPTGFAALGVPPDVDRGLAEAGFTQPFAIQIEAVPVALTGQDVCGRARTGSGKTLAFGVPMLSRITPNSAPNRPHGLVLVPTRELALQVAEVLAPIAKACGKVVLAAYGGSSRQDQVTLLEKGVDLVVATPLRLVDLIKGKEVDLSEIEVVVIDEADRMADDGFTPQVEWILRHVTGVHQTMLFSATLDGQVGHLVRRYLKDPVEIAIDAANDTVGTMHHVFLGVHHMDKDRVIASICKTAQRVVVFCGTKRMCDRVTDNLRDLDVSAAAIHGDLPQPSREKALKRFSMGELKVLVATDVAARGIDVDGIDVVIHHEPASDAKAYLHRSGRTARAGNDGWAVTLVEYNQHLHARMIQRALRLTISDPIQVFSNDERLLDLGTLVAATT
ncbi:MAG: DEAD/DEAH box helicase [Actinobacteria bacterium]|uniref:Unannotated protein n=1 Tax=freshwater metagenome TaxID=449393 RepID=A0A6J6USJ5_9ZZZZ|nr:DEAD/DEAH box helicase [Actinomycetota bacterium]MSZ04512.1 DEAD/DEAH box helicase [Actinomycetota bacterium]MTB06342.1 DEAD/DEAH box helicase [Actinomycetota bacterium]